MVNNSFYAGGALGALVVALTMIGFMAYDSDKNYSLPKSEYNQLTEHGKNWAYVLKDGK